MRKRLSPDRIAKTLQEVQADLDAGLNVNQACRKVGYAPTTDYRWKSPRENPASIEQIRVSELEAEVGRLKLLAAEAVRSWLEATGSGALDVAPASPWQNGYAESFHSKLRDEFLNLEDFESQAQAQALGTPWKEEYNTERPHSSLAYQTPSEFAARFERYVPIDETPSEPRPDEHPHP
jgi:hypothetical protein